MLAKIVNMLYLGCLWISIQAYKKVNESQYTVEMAYCALHLEMHSSEGEKYAEDVWHKKWKRRFNYPSEHALLIPKSASLWVILCNAFKLNLVLKPNVRVLNVNHPYKIRQSA